MSKRKETIFLLILLTILLNGVLNPYILTLAISATYYLVSWSYLSVIVAALVVLIKLVLNFVSSRKASRISK